MELLTPTGLVNMENNILDLDPDSFMSALDELGISGDQRDFLMREYQNRQGSFSSLLGFLSGMDQDMSSRGRERAALLPVEKPADASVLDAISSGDWDWAVPSSAIEAVRGSVRGVDAAGNMLAGVPYTEQQMQEAATAAAGTAMLGGGAFPSPAGSLRSNAPSWFGKKLAQMTPEEKDLWFAADHEVHSAHMAAKNAATEQGLPVEEVVPDFWKKVDPNPDIDAVPAPIPDDDLIDLESIDLDFEPLDDPVPPKLYSPPKEISIEMPKPSWHGKHVLDMSDEEFTAYQEAGSPKSDFNSGMADADGMTVEQWLDSGTNKPSPKPEPDPQQDAEYERLLSELQGNGGVPLPATDAERRAVEVANMLRTGRASEISNEFYDAADLAYLRKLYDANMTGRVLPMDFKSRMERAAGMGFNTGNPLYRGRGSDRAHNEENNTFTSDEPAVAAGYVGFKENDFYGNMVKLLARGGNEMPEVRPPPGTSWSGMGDESPVLMPDGTEISLYDFMSKAGRAGDETYATDYIGRAARDLGFPGVRFRQIRDPGGSKWDDAYAGTGMSAYSPSNVRIDVEGSANLRVPTAFFDPRLSHLRNYSAANASPLTGAAALAAEEDDARQRLMRYLDDIEAER